MRGDRLGDSFDVVVPAARTGAAWAMDRLWRAYAGPVAAYLRLQGAAEPDDLTSEVFIGVFRSIGTFRGDEAAFRSWLFTIAHRRVVDARRSAGRRPAGAPLDEGLSASGPGPESEVLRRLAEERVRDLCERLVPDQRDVLLLRLVVGATVEEAATVLGKSPGAVKALQRRGLAAVRRLLDQEGVPL